MGTPLSFSRVLSSLLLPLLSLKRALALCHFSFLLELKNENSVILMFGEGVLRVGGTRISEKKIYFSIRKFCHVTN